MGTGFCHGYNWGGCRNSARQSAEIKPKRFPFLFVIKDNILLPSIIVRFQEPVTETRKSAIIETDSIVGHGLLEWRWWSQGFSNRDEGEDGRGNEGMLPVHFWLALGVQTSCRGCWILPLRAIGAIKTRRFSVRNKMGTWTHKPFNLESTADVGNTPHLILHQP